MDMVKVILIVLVAYFLGNISPSTILGRMHGIDIKKEGSGNAGTTNALRVMGKKAGAITLVVDILKGFVAVEIGTLVCGKEIGYVCALAAFLGHIWPVLYKFKGGKGIAVAFGALLGVNWMIGIGCLLVVIVTVILTKMVSLGSVMAAILFPLFAYFWEKDFLVIGVPMACISLFAHRENIKRILKGEENKLNFKK